MRTKTILDTGWFFSSRDIGPILTLKQGNIVTIPHTWNATDGQDGGNDYYRGKCWYVKKLEKPLYSENEEVWLEFEGAAMTAEVFLNGNLLTHHDGGYSTFRVNLTDYLLEDNLIAVSVDNSANRTVYPQKADFTFYGGLYRDVSLLIVPKAHFALDCHGGPGIKVTPKLSDDLTSAQVLIEAECENMADGSCVQLQIDGIGSCNVQVNNSLASGVISISPVHLWNGVDDPYLYTARAKSDSGDEVSARFGCRTIGFDSQKGFYLNGKNLRLVGVARHQDRAGIGNALTKAEHDEDMAIIRDMGANTVRLAHYQHAQYFYDLCDEYGLVAWAEIPYITEHMPEGRANTLSQMEELVCQNYNHASIICWGLSNEITVTTGVTEDMVENHRLLNDLCHKLDTTRPTTMAHAFMLDMNNDFVMLPDIRSYNLYYGWYLGSLEQNDEWFDDFHAAYPDAVIGLSEYGADANDAYQSSSPKRGDWSETYQAVYHEHLLGMWSERPYIWAMHCWNGFDFAADGRNEGGKPGQNQKGLVTFDRKIKKDAFYIYKAYLSKDSFIHLCGSRYIDRVESETEIKVYSNLHQITLFVDGKEFEKKTGDKVFKFKVPISSEHTITACAGEIVDEIHIRKVNQPNLSYRKDGEAEIVNWFDKPEEVIRDGYYSIMDTMEDIKKNPVSAELLAQIRAKASASYGDVAKNVQMPESIQRQMDKMSLKSMLDQAGKSITPEMVKQLNAALNKIPKEI